MCVDFIGGMDTDNTRAQFAFRARPVDDKRLIIAFRPFGRLAPAELRPSK